MKYQAFLRASGVNTVVAKLSTHEQGNAADVAPKDGKIDAFLKLAEKQFDSIGTASTFLHLDLRNVRAIPIVTGKQIGRAHV